jgi:hypothetical protein
MAGIGVVVLANVTEPGDVVLLAIVLALTVVVGGALFALDLVLGRVRAKRKSKGPASSG